MRPIFFLPVIALSLCFSTGAVLSDDLYQKAKVLFEKNKYSEALKIINSANISADKSLQPRFLKGLILMKMEMYDEAEKIFDGLTFDYPKHPEPYNNLAVIHTQRGDFERARKSLEAAIKTNPSFQAAYENLGKLYAQLASEAYKKAIKKTPLSDNSIQLSLLLNITNAPFVISSESSKVAESASVNIDSTRNISGINSKSVPKTSKKQISDTVLEWASAWSAKDVDKYLGYYAKTFKSSQKSWEEWAALRRSRINGPKSISISVYNLKIVSESDTDATVRFEQHYKSNLIDSKGIKTLILQKIKEDWLIKQELFSK